MLRQVVEVKDEVEDDRSTLIGSLSPILRLLRGRERCSEVAVKEKLVVLSAEGAAVVATGFASRDE